MSLMLNKRCFCLLKLLNNKRIKSYNNININLLSKTLSNLNNENNAINDNKRRESFSSLYVSGRYGSVVFNVLKPKLDSNYLKQLINNINDIKLIYNRRQLNVDIDFNKFVIHLNDLIELKTTLEPLKLRRDEFKKKADSLKKTNKTVSNELISNLKDISLKIKDLNEKVWDLEEIVMPLVLNLPNDMRSDVNQEIKTNVIYSFEPKKQKTTTNLDYMRLSYYNKCMSPSIVGPHSYYLIESGAQLQFSLIEYFIENLRQNQFTDISGIDFVKSAIVEATNCQHLRDYRNDNCAIDRGYNSNEDNQHLHLVGNASLESFCAIISKRLINLSYDQIRLLSVGQHFEPSFQQNNCINTFIIAKENVSDNEMTALYELLWNCFIKLDIKCRLILSNAQQLNNNEYVRYNIEVWLNSQKEWLTVSKITHYKDYISLRIGLSNVHIIESSINIYPIIISIIEQNQTNEGNFETPQCLKQYLI